MLSHHSFFTSHHLKPIICDGVHLRGRVLSSAVSGSGGSCRGPSWHRAWRGTASRAWHRAWRGTASLFVSSCQISKQSGLIRPQFEIFSPAYKKKNRFYSGVSVTAAICMSCYPKRVSGCCGSVAKSCLTLGDPGDCSTPGFPVLHHLPELAQTYVHRVSDAIQPSCPLSSPSPPAFSLSQHQGLFQ